MIRYYKLFDLMNRRGISKTDLREILSPKTVAKLSKGDNITTEVLNKICEYLDCQPGDIMEYTNMAYDNIQKKEVELAIHKDEDTEEITNLNAYSLQKNNGS